jgi:hypothetical protein
MKPMKKSLKNVMFLVLSVSSFSVLAGQGSSGGGDALLCYKTTEIRNRVYNSILKHSESSTPVNLELQNLSKAVDILDVWEAHKPSGFPGSNSTRAIHSLSVEEIYKKVEEVLPKFYNDFFKMHITQPVQWREEDYGVLEINDSGYVGKVPDNCLISQIAYYDDTTNLIHFDGRIVNSLSGDQIRALRLHEDLYRFNRSQVKDYNAHCKYYKNHPSYIANCSYKTPNSSTTRQFVGYLISNQGYLKNDLLAYAKSVSEYAKGPMGANYWEIGYKGE